MASALKGGYTMAGNAKYALKVDNIHKSFGGIKALNGVSFEIPPKTVNLIIGPNGSGKTTLINCITGVYKPDKGRVLIYLPRTGELDITDKPPHERTKFGIVRTFQVGMPFYKLTVLENLLVAYQNNPGESSFWSLFKKKWIDYEVKALEKAFKILELLQLDHLYDAPAYTLSGGQVRLLEIGRALMTDARIILMDEPVGSVNPVLAHEIFTHILGLRDRIGITFVIVEHRLDIALKYVDYVFAMAEGKIIAEGTPERIVKDPEVIKSYLGG